METLGHGNAHAPSVIIAPHQCLSYRINVTITPPLTSMEKGSSLFNIPDTLYYA
jgi:hypothetical protein